ncbi:MAG: AsmA family protein [Pseudobdellovibrionaceae bacterium]|jgi:uncharacterized protein involved in outer membrane biogenesis|nr:AsmA family protein [Pseudobdellovibrionaceae bacterium]
MSENTSRTDSQHDDIKGFDDPSPKTMKWIKLLGGTAIGLVVLAGGVGIVASSMIDQQKYKSLIIEKVDEATGYKVDWQGDIGLSLLPLPHVTISDLSVEANNQKILTIKTADVEVALLPLLSKKVEIKDVTLEEPHITLVTLKDGTQSWMTGKLAKSQGQNSAGVESNSGSEEEASSMDVSLNVVEITDGNFVWDDQSKGQRQSIEDLDVRLKADSLSGPFEVNGGMIWNGHKIEAKINTSDLDIKNGLYPVQIKVALPDNNIQTEFSGTITQKDQMNIKGDVVLETADIAAAVGSLSGGVKVNLPPELAGKARLTGEVNVTPQRVSLNAFLLDVGQLAYGGNASIDGLDKSGSVPQVSFDMKSNDKADGNASSLIKFMDDLSVSASGTMKDDYLVINKSEFKIENNDLKISGKVGLGSEKKKVDLIVSSQSIDVDQIMKKLGMEIADNSSASGESSTTSMASSDAKDSGFSLPFEGRVRADIRDVTYQSKSYENIILDLAASGQSIQLSKFEAKIPDNIFIKASGEVGDAGKLSGINMSLNAKVPDVELAAKSYGVSLPETPKKIGAATLDGKFTGDLKSIGFSTTIGVWGFSFGGSGKIASVLENPVINHLNFKVSHPDFVEAMRIVQPTFKGSSTLTGGMYVAGDVTWGDNQYILKSLDANFGKTNVKGDMEISLSPKPSVTGTLSIGTLALPTSDQGGSAKTTTVQKSQASSSSGGSAKWSREAIDVSWMKSFNANLKVSAQSLSYDLWDFRNANLECSLNEGVLNIKDMSAGLFGGAASISGQIKTGTGERDPLSVSGELSANNVDAQKLVSAAMGKMNTVFSGTMSDVNVSVNATGLSPAALVQTLNGEGNVSGKDIVVQGVDAAQLAMAAKGSYKPMERAGTLFGSFGDGKTEFSVFESVFNIQNGVINFTKVNMDGPKAVLTSTGNVNLPLWTVSLNNSMTIKDTDIPPFEFTIKGSLDNPTKAGGDVIENYLRGKFEKKVNKLIENKLNKLLGVQEESAPAAVPSDGTSTIPSTEGAAETTSNTNSKDALKKDALKALGGLLGGQ